MKLQIVCEDRRHLLSRAATARARPPHFSPTLSTTRDTACTLLAHAHTHAHSLAVSSQWDTAGQERFRTITSAYYRGADGIFIVFDVAHRESFEHVRDWAAEVSKYAAPGIPRLLIGNKSDRSDRVVTEAEGQSLAESLSMHYLETSAKTAERVTDAFNALTAELLAKKSAAPAERNNNDGSVTVSGQGSTGKSGCC